MLWLNGCGKNSGFWVLILAPFAFCLPLIILLNYLGSKVDPLRQLTFKIILPKTTESLQRKKRKKSTFFGYLVTSVLKLTTSSCVMASKSA